MIKLRELLEYIEKLDYNNVECLEDYEDYYGLSVKNDKTKYRIFIRTEINSRSNKNNDVYTFGVESILVQHPYICYPTEDIIKSSSWGSSDDDLFGFLFEEEERSLNFQNIEKAIWTIDRPLEMELEALNYHLENLQFLIYNLKDVLKEFGFIPMSTNILSSLGAKHFAGFAEDNSSAEINFCHLNGRNDIHLCFRTDILSGELKESISSLSRISDIKTLTEDEVKTHIEEWMWNNGSPRIEFEYYFEGKSDTKYTIESYREIIKLINGKDGVDYTKIPNKYIKLARGK